ncbi:MAG TPA: MliC family protein [Steroidobacteraceae bacterium]|nr:MliC family protein [Steroidobacteraceae bacterium]
MSSRRSVVCIVGGLLAWALAPAPGVAAADGPSFDCRTVEAGSIASLICADSGLSALDRQLAQVYADASKKAVDEHPPVLKAEQRGWIKGRDDCWKSDDRRACVEQEYRLRIAELQARYRLVSFTGPFTFVCDAPAGGEVVVTHFRTDPPTLIAERGDSVSLMFVQPSGSGARYQGRNESFWEHQGVASVTWGYGAPEMRCKLQH